MEKREAETKKLVLHACFYHSLILMLIELSHSVRVSDNWLYSDTSQLYFCPARATLTVERKHSGEDQHWGETHQYPKEVESQCSRHSEEWMCSLKNSWQMSWSTWAGPSHDLVMGRWLGEMRGVWAEAQTWEIWNEWKAKCNSDR
jgi:hypothetical protein